MTIIHETEDRILLIEQAIVVSDDMDVASWASRHMYANPGIKWIVGNYAEADEANRNGTMFGMDDFKEAQQTVAFSPMNIDHQQNRIVGTWIASEMIYPKSDQADSRMNNPYLQVLGAYWKKKFPDTLKRVEAAFDAGMLAISMEAVGESVTCAGETGCGSTFPYKGPFHPSYCEHINSRASAKQVNKPQFRGGALILPPNRPGWAKASVEDMAHDVSDENLQELAEQVETTFPQLDAAERDKLALRLQLSAFESIR